MSQFCSQSLASQSDLTRRVSCEQHLDACSSVHTHGHVTRCSWLKTKHAIIHTSYSINFAVQTSQPQECIVRPCACSELVVKDTSWAVSGVRRQFFGLTGTDPALGTCLTRGALRQRNASVLTGSSITGPRCGIQNPAASSLALRVALMRRHSCSAANSWPLPCDLSCN